MGIPIGANIKQYPNGQPIWIECDEVLYYPNGFQKSPSSFKAKGICRIYNDIPRPDSVKHLIAAVPDGNIGPLPVNMSWEPFGFRIIFVPEEDCRIYCEMN
jgi:hypothetical protein